MSEIFFVRIEAGSLDENRGEAGLKTYTNIITFDDLESVNKIRRIETDLIISFYFCWYFCLTRSELCIARIEANYTRTFESHFHIKIVFSCDKTDLTESLYKL